jgi:hypothetical protein
MIGRCAVVTLHQEFVTEEALEYPHLMAQVPGSEELMYSFPLHPTHYEQWVSELFVMEHDVVFTVSLQDVATVLENVSTEPPESDDD